MSVVSKIRNKKLHGQAREMVNNVLAFMDAESKQDPSTINLRKVQERCAKATGVSLRTVTNIKKQSESVGVEPREESAFTTPDKKRTYKKRVTDIDDFDVQVIRRTIYNFYVQEQCLLTVEKLRKKLAESINYNGSGRSLRRILRAIGFRWMKTSNNRKVLVEKEDIRLKRINYLQLLKRYKETGRLIVYMDETYIHSTHTSSKSWSDDSTQVLLQPLSKGQRLIIIHAGGKDGFVPNALLMWKSNQATGDYHNQMNSVNYEKWLKEKLVPNLKPHTVLVVDNAAYHNTVIDRAPTLSSRKDVIKEWLSKHNIQFDETMFKPQLCELVKIHKPANAKYTIDEIMRRHGHAVLRLPPYHPELNPIEMIWGKVNNWVATKNVTFRMEDMIKLCNSKFGEMGAEDWIPICEHVERIEAELIHKEGIIDEEIERFIINVGESDSSETDASSDGVYGVEELV